MHLGDFHRKPLAYMAYIIKIIPKFNGSLKAKCFFFVTRAELSTQPYKVYFISLHLYFYLYCDYDLKQYFFTHILVLLRKFA